MPSPLTVEGLHHRYGSTVALQHADLLVEPGELTALLGPSGSGKSTLLAAVAGMIQPTGGRIMLGNRDLTRQPAEQRGLGMVFQDYALWPHMTAIGNVAMPLVWRGVRGKPAIERAGRALERVGLESMAQRRPAQLSGGQQQRVALARAIVSEPELLLLDEPLSALDPDTRASVRAELAELLRSLGITTILVTHDRDDAFELADKVAVLLNGRIEQHGTPQEVFEQPASLDAARFLGVNLLPANGTGKGVAEVAGQKIRVPDGAPSGPFALAIAEGGIRLADAQGSNDSQLTARLISGRYASGGYRLRVAVPGVDTALVVHSRQPVHTEEVLLEVPVSSMHIVSHAAQVA